LDERERLFEWCVKAQVDTFLFLCLSLERRREKEKEKLSFSLSRARKQRLLSLSLSSLSHKLPCRSFFALRASSNASFASDAAITSTSGTMLVTGDTGETGVSESAAMSRK